MTMPATWQIFYDVCFSAVLDIFITYCKKSSVDTNNVVRERVGGVSALISIILSLQIIKKTMLDWINISTWSKKKCAMS